MKMAVGQTYGAIATGGSTGDGAAQLHNPTSVLVDKSGNIYVTDTFNHRIMWWPPGAKSGIVVVGGRGAGNRSDQLNQPHDLAFDQDENLYVLDRDNQRVQKFMINND